MVTSLQLFTDFHTAISLVALVFGGPALLTLFKKFPNAMPSVTAFLALAFTSTLTGFFFPFHGFTPAIGVGIVTMVIFTVMYVAYKRGLTGVWRPVFALGMVAQEFFLVFVTIAQSFQKIPALNMFASTSSEPAFPIAAGTAFIVFAVIGGLAAIKFKPFSRTGR